MTTIFIPNPSKFYYVYPDSPQYAKINTEDLDIDFYIRFRKIEANSHKSHYHGFTCTFGLYTRINGKTKVHRAHTFGINSMDINGLHLEEYGDWNDFKP